MRKEAEKPLFLSLNLNFLRSMKIQKPKLRLRKVLEEVRLPGKDVSKNALYQTTDFLSCLRFF